MARRRRRPPRPIIINYYSVKLKTVDPPVGCDGCRWCHIPAAQPGDVGFDGRYSVPPPDYKPTFASLAYRCPVHGRPEPKCPPPAKRRR